MGNPIQCEMVTMTVTDETGLVGVLVLPAYTRPATDLRDVLDSHFETYLENSTGSVSLADFTLYLASVASLEPRLIED